MPDHASEVIYFRRRAEAEATAAEHAATRQAASLHRDLARLCEERAAFHRERMDEAMPVT